MADDVLILGDTERCAELRHELPLSVGDPFLYAEAGGVRHVVIPSLEGPRLRELAGPLEIHLNEEFGIDELLASTGNRDVATLEVHARAVRAFGIRAAVVPAAFPLELADRLRADGVELRVDRGFFDGRRRVKSDAELAGIRRAQAGTDAAMDAARALLRASEPGPDGVLQLDGAPLTCERLRARVYEVFAEHALAADSLIVSHGAQTAVGHDEGSGPIRAGEPVLLDLFPRDRASGCFTDMTRVWVKGTPAPEIAEWHALCVEALRRATAAARPGITGKTLFEGTCELFEAHGHATQRTKTPGVPLDHGFYHSLGHGVGLEVHEEPSLGRSGGEPLVAGDVLAIEPGLYRPGFGGLRVEDTILVTADGGVPFTTYPYDLEP